MPDVLRVHLQIVACCGEDWVAGVAEQLVRLLIHAHHRPGRIVGTGVDGEDVLHRGHERGVRLRWDRPALPQMRTKFRFFRSLPMVE